MGLVESEDIIFSSEVQDVFSRISKREENDVLYNNNKIRSYLFDENVALELDIRLKSISMAIKKGRLELLMNILSSFSDMYKFAALDIKYFDANNSSLKVDIMKAFAQKGDVRLLSKNLKSMLSLFDDIEKLSATNAAIAINSAIILGENKKIIEILSDEKLGHAFILQIKKRYADNFSKNIEEDIKNLPVYETSKRALLAQLKEF